MRIKYALRSLAASPSFTLGSIFCLAIGLSFTIAAFSMINAALFRSMPGIRDQGSLRNLWTGKEIDRPAAAAGVRVQGEGVVRIFDNVPLEAYRAYQQGLEGVADVLAFTTEQVALRYEGTPHAARAVFVSPNYFEVLGTQAAIGHVPTAADEQAVLVGDIFWRTQMNAVEDPVGRTIDINGRTLRVTGVAPPKFVGATQMEFEDEPARIPAVWASIAALDSAAGASAPPSFHLVARLRPGESESGLEARAAGTARGLNAADPQKYRGAFVRIRPLHRGPHEDPAETVTAIAIVMCIPIGILAIGCANVANLLLARGTSRARDFAVRLALGASRRRVVEELLLESLLLAVGGAIVALGLCAILVRFVEHQVPLPVAIDLRVTGFALAMGFVTALLFGLLPALTASRAPITSRVHDARRVRPLTRRVLVATQLALSTALLVVAAVLIRSAIHTTTPRLAIDESRVAAMSYDVELAKYDRAQASAFARDLLQRVRTLPGVEAAGISADTPFQPRESWFTMDPAFPGDRSRSARAGAISEGWLEASGSRVVAGRDFLAAERSGVPTTVLVNEVLARRLWPGGTAVGRSLVVLDPRVSGAPRYDVQVVGVVTDGLSRRLDREPAPMAYLPTPITFVTTQALWVRTQTDPRNLMPLLRSAAAELAPEVPVTRLETAAEARHRLAGPFRWLAQGMTAAGAIALGLAALGLFALLTYLMAQRSREVGIRMALGARRADIIRLVVGESAWVALGGAVAGSLIGGSAAAYLRSEMWGIVAVDPITFLAAAAVLMTAAVAASAHPALRASRTDPGLGAAHRVTVPATTAYRGG